MAMTEQDRDLQLCRLRGNLELFAGSCLKIKDKSGDLVPFVFNRAQKYIHERLEQQKRETGKVRAIILKGRKQGASTYIAARYYHQAVFHGRSAFIVAHEDLATTGLFEIVKRYQSNNLLAPSTKASSAKELIFKALDCGYKLATAGTDDVGRGNTAQLIHGCLSPDSLIVSGANNALLRMGDMQIGDLVRTHTGQVAAVSFISEQQKPARTVALSSVSALPLVATDEHRFWTPDGWKELRDIEVGDEIGFPIKSITNSHLKEKFRLPNTVRPQGGGSGEAGPDEVKLNYSLGRVLGLYLAEGTVKLQNKSGEPCGVHFAVHENEVTRTLDWLSDVSGLFRSASVYRHKTSKTCVVTAYGRSFAAFVSRLCGHGKDKFAPSGWECHGEEFARGLVHGYLAGDGHFTPSRDRRIRATSIRSSLTVAMRDMLASLGYGWASITRKNAAVRCGRNEKEAYVLSLCGLGVNQLSQEVGKPFVEQVRKSGGGKASSRIADGYAWLKVLSKSDEQLVDVMDFEIDHIDHSYCTIHGATHNSEYAFWRNPQKHMAGLGNVVGNVDGTEFVLESTANGIGNGFHQLWQDSEAGKGEFITIFTPWFWDDSYRSTVSEGFARTDHEVQLANIYGLDNEQLQFRRNKIASYGDGYEWLFRQEFPNCAAEAFVIAVGNPLIAPDTVMAAVNSTFRDPDAQLLIGCDPAGDGVNDPDRTAIAFRRGRMVPRIEYHQGLDTMQIAGKLAAYYREHNPAAIFVDKGGLGAGVFDRLRELGIPVIGVNSAARANDPERYENKRAEMWWLMAEWFADSPCRIPNDAALISDLTAPQPKVSSNGRKLLEKKDDMAKRQVRSPDGADALALSFSEQVANVQQGFGGWSSTKQAPTAAGY